MEHPAVGPASVESDALKQRGPVSEGTAMATAEQNVVTVTEATGVNQALVLQCSLVTLKDGPRKSPKENSGCICG